MPPPDGDDMKHPSDKGNTTRHCVEGGSDTMHRSARYQRIFEDIRDAFAEDERNDNTHDHPLDSVSSQHDRSVNSERHMRIFGHITAGLAADERKKRDAGQSPNTASAVARQTTRRIMKTSTTGVTPNHCTQTTHHNGVQRVRNTRNPPGSTT